MKMTLPVIISALLAAAVALGLALAPTGSDQDAAMDKTKLAVVWSSGDPEVAHKVCFMYTHNAKLRGWFDEVTLIVWGPSARLLTEDTALQEKIKAMAADGVTLEACLACADSYGVSDKLRALGVDVKYMGVPLSEMLQGNWKVLTF